VTRPTMTCPKCGTLMNHQAEKLVHPVTDEEISSQSVAFDGVLLQVFACPRCGWIESRREDGEPTASA
jgi:ribosomal protein S27AE